MENNRKSRIDWLSDLKFGALVSWGPCVVWGGVQSWCLDPSEAVAEWARPDDFEPWIEHGRDMKPFSDAYYELYKQFNPHAFDAEKLVTTLRDGGIRYAGLTTKHHDGFCMFDTLTTDFKITSRQCPYAANPGADVSRAFYNAVHSNGLGALCYFSKSDWHTPYYWSPMFPVKDRNINYDRTEHPEIWEKFKKHTYRQVEELMSGYGHMDILWLDGGQVRPPRMDIDMEKLATMARNHHKDLLVVDRTVGGEYEDYPTPEQHVPDEPVEGFWEACATIQKKGWVWRKNAEYWSTTELVHRLVRIVSDGGNYLVGLGPDGNGLLAPEVAERLAEIGNWMSVNGEGIYGTRRGNFVANRVNDSIVYTRSSDGGIVYAHILEWPGDFAVIRGFEGAERLSSVTMLGNDAPLRWEAGDGMVRVKLDGVKKSCEHAWVLKMVK